MPPGANPQPKDTQLTGGGIDLVAWARGHLRRNKAPIPGPGDAYARLDRLDRNEAIARMSSTIPGVRGGAGNTYVLPKDPQTNPDNTGPLNIGEPPLPEGATGRDSAGRPYYGPGLTGFLQAAASAFSTPDSFNDPSQRAQENIKLNQDMLMRGRDEIAKLGAADVKAIGYDTYKTPITEVPIGKWPELFGRAIGEAGQTAGVLAKGILGPLGVMTGLISDSVSEAAGRRSYSIMRVPAKAIAGAFFVVSRGWEWAQMRAAAILAAPVVEYATTLKRGGTVREARLAGGKALGAGIAGTVGLTEQFRKIVAGGPEDNAGVMAWTGLVNNSIYEEAKSRMAEGQDPNLVYWELSNPLVEMVAGFATSWGIGAIWKASGLGEAAIRALGVDRGAAERVMLNASEFEDGRSALAIEPAMTMDRQASLTQGLVERMRADVAATVLGQEKLQTGAGLLDQMPGAKGMAATRKVFDFVGETAAATMNVAEDGTHSINVDAVMQHIDAVVAPFRGGAADASLAKSLNTIVHSPLGASLWSQRSREVGWILSKIMGEEDDLPWLQAALRDASEAGTGPEAERAMVQTIGKRLQTETRNIYPQFAEAVAEDEKAAKLAKAAGESYEHKFPVLTRTLIQLDHNLTLAYSPLMKMFSAFYMGLSPFYVAKNLISNTIHIAFDMGVRSVFRSRVASETITLKMLGYLPYLSEQGMGGIVAGAFDTPWWKQGSINKFLFGLDWAGRVEATGAAQVVAASVLDSARKFIRVAARDPEWQVALEEIGIKPAVFEEKLLQTGTGPEFLKWLRGRARAGYLEPFREISSLDAGTVEALHSFPRLDLDTRVADAMQAGTEEEFVAKMDAIRADVDRVGRQAAYDLPVFDATDAEMAPDIMAIHQDVQAGRLSDSDARLFSNKLGAQRDSAFGWQRYVTETAKQTYYKIASRLKSYGLTDEQVDRLMPLLDKTSDTLGVVESGRTAAFEDAGKIRKRFDLVMDTVRANRNDPASWRGILASAGVSPPGSVRDFGKLMGDLARQKSALIDANYTAARVRIGESALQGLSDMPPHTAQVLSADPEALAILGPEKIRGLATEVDQLIHSNAFLDQARDLDRYAAAWEAVRPSDIRALGVGFPVHPGTRAVLEVFSSLGIDTGVLTPGGQVIPFSMKTLVGIARRGADAAGIDAETAARLFTGESFKLSNAWSPEDLKILNDSLAAYKSLREGGGVVTGALPFTEGEIGVASEEATRASRVTRLSNEHVVTTSRDPGAGKWIVRVTDRNGGQIGADFATSRRATALRAHQDAVNRAVTAPSAALVGGQMPRQAPSVRDWIEGHDWLPQALDEGRDPIAILATGKKELTSQAVVGTFRAVMQDAGVPTEKIDAILGSADIADLLKVEHYKAAVTTLTQEESLNVARTWLRNYAGDRAGGVITPLDDALSMEGWYDPKAGSWQWGTSAEEMAGQNHGRYGSAVFLKRPREVGTLQINARDELTAREALEQFLSDTGVSPWAQSVNVQIPPQVGGAGQTWGLRDALAHLGSDAVVAHSSISSAPGMTAGQSMSLYLAQSPSVGGAATGHALGSMEAWLSHPSSKLQDTGPWLSRLSAAVDANPAASDLLLRKASELIAADEVPTVEKLEGLLAEAKGFVRLDRSAEFERLVSSAAADAEDARLLRATFARLDGPGQQKAISFLKVWQNIQHPTGDATKLVWSRDQLLGWLRTELGFDPIADPLPTVYGAGTSPSEARAVRENADGIHRTLDDIQQQVASHWGNIEEFNLSGARMGRAEAFADEVERRLAEQRPVWSEVATEQRKFTLHDYADKRIADHVGSFGMPYHFWYNRTYLRWFARIAAHPEILGYYAAYRRTLERIHRDAPDFYKRQVSTDELFGWLGLHSKHPLYFNLEQSLNPLYGILGVDFDNPAFDEKKASAVTNLIIQANKFGPTVFTPFVWAAAFALWKRGQGEAAQSMVGRLLPVTGTIHNIAGTLGVNLEVDPLVQLFQGGTDYWEGRRIGKKMGDYLATNQYPAAEIMDQAYARKGPVWDAAQREVQQERGGGWLGNIVGSIVGGGFKSRTEGDIQIDRYYQDRNKLIAMEPFLSPEETRQGWDQLRRLYPFADAISVSRGDPAHRLQAFSYSILSRIPPGAGKEFYEWARLSPELVDKFYADKGHTDKWSPGDRAQWEGGILAIAGALDMPDTATRESWDAARSEYRLLTTQMKAQFGDDIEQQTDEYFAQPEDKADAYLQQHPAVQQALDWRSAYVLNHPVLNAYYGGVDVLERYYKGLMYEDAKRVFGPDIFDLQDAARRVEQRGGNLKAFLNGSSELFGDHSRLTAYKKWRNAQLDIIESKLNDYENRQAERFDARARHDYDKAALSSLAVLSGLYDSRAAAVTPEDAALEALLMQYDRSQKRRPVPVLPSAQDYYLGLPYDVLAGRFFDRGLQDALERHFQDGAPLAEGDRKDLQRVWAAMGSPLGSLGNWLERDLKQKFLQGSGEVPQVPYPAGSLYPTP